jgi:hypothetical protein
MWPLWSQGTVAIIFLAYGIVFKFLCWGRWVFPCSGCFLFLGLVINLCFVPWNSVVQKLLSLISVMCRNAWESPMWWALWSSLRFLAPSMHTLISNPGGCGQCCVRYPAKCLAVLSSRIHTHTWHLNIMCSYYCYFSTTFFGHSFGPLSGRGYNYINGNTVEEASHSKSTW